MKIELYLVPEDKEGKLIKEFLIKNNLAFREIITNDLDLLNKVAQMKSNKKMSLLKIKYSRAIHVIRGFQPLALKQLLEHIKKYKPKIE